MRYLVTGGAGFIGSHLAERLVKDGHDVRVIDNFSTGHVDNVPAGVQLFRASITTPEVVRDAVRDVDVIFHQAALPSVPRSMKDPLATNYHNVQGTLTLLQAAADAGVRLVIQASSASVYGSGGVLPRREEMPFNPCSPYAASKVAGEMYGKAFAASLGVGYVALRYFNVFGPRQDPNSQYSAVIPKFIKAALLGHTATVHGDGEQARDFCYVDNVVEANLLAAAAPTELVSGKAFNVACGKQTTLLGLLTIIDEALDVRTRRVFTSPRPGDVKNSYACIDFTHDRLGYEPKVHVKEGLERTIRYYQDRL